MTVGILILWIVFFIVFIAWIGTIYILLTRPIRKLSDDIGAALISFTFIGLLILGILSLILFLEQLILLIRIIKAWWEAEL